MTDYQPDESDAFITDTARGYAVAFDGKHLGTVAEYDEASALIAEEMQRHNYYPNVWRVSDHGNAELITDQF